jgi:hypothetical protein
MMDASAHVNATISAAMTDPGGFEHLDGRVIQLLTQRPDGLSNDELLRGF